MGRVASLLACPHLVHCRAAARHRRLPIQRGRGYLRRREVRGLCDGLCLALVVVIVGRGGGGGRLGGTNLVLVREAFHSFLFITIIYSHLSLGRRLGAALPYSRRISECIANAEGLCSGFVDEGKERPCERGGRILDYLGRIKTKEDAQAWVGRKGCVRAFGWLECRHGGARGGGRSGRRGAPEGPFRQAGGYEVGQCLWCSDFFTFRQCF